MASAWVFSIGRVVAFLDISYLKYETGIVFSLG